MKNKSVINTPRYSAALLSTSGNRARNTLSQLTANHVSSSSAQAILPSDHAPNTVEVVARPLTRCNADTLASFPHKSPRQLPVQFRSNILFFLPDTRRIRVVTARRGEFGDLDGERESLETKDGKQESLETKDGDRESLETKDGERESLQTKHGDRERMETLRATERNSTGLWTLP